MNGTFQTGQVIPVNKLCNAVLVLLSSYLPILFVRAAILIFGILITGTTAAKAQGNLSRRIDFEAKNLPLAEALIQLSKASGMAIGFSDPMLGTPSRVQLDLKNERISTILHKILEGSGLGWRESGGQVLLYKLPPPEQILSGFIEDATNGERLVGAQVSELNSGRSSTTNAYGFFSLRVPMGAPVFLVTTMLGFQPVRIMLAAANVQKQMTFALQPMTTTMEAVEVSGDSLADQSKPFFIRKEENITRLPIFQMPLLGGEADLMRAAAFLPGIESSIDGFGGWSVRGGETDQNMVLMDDAVVFNPVHGMGLFSAFNPDIVRSARLWKGDAPARIGGGASSAWDVRTKEGNMQRPAGAVSLGWLAGRVSLELPFKEKGAMLFSARRSLAGPVIQYFAQKQDDENDSEVNTNFYFSDLNWKINWILNKRNRVYVSLYDGHDAFKDDKMITYTSQDTFGGDPMPSTNITKSENRSRWNNRFVSLRWNHLFSDKLFSNTTFTGSRFQIKSTGNESFEILGIFAQNVVSISQTQLYDYSLKSDWDWYYSDKLNLRGGFQASSMRIRPFYYSGIENSTLPEWLEYDENGNLGSSPKVAYENGLLSAVYGESEWRHGAWRIRTGLRTDVFHNRGKTWVIPQPRISVEKKMAHGITFISALNRNAQMLRAVSPQGIESPSDFWLMANPNLAPQNNWQLTAGLGWENPNWSIRAEAYVKKLNNIEEYKVKTIRDTFVTPDSTFVIDYQDGFRAWENEMTLGQGKSMGLELLLEKKLGRTKGWISWTLSRSLRQFDELNKQQWFPARLDRLQNLKIVLIQQLSPHFSVSANWQMASGDAISSFYVSPDFGFNNRLLDFYKVGFQTGRIGFGNYRQPYQHRLDLAVNGQWEVRKITHQLTLGCYNAYGQANTFFTVFTDTEDLNNDINKQKIRGLPFLPHLSWSLRF
jgi:TonB-dependent Receptor Plug Domain